MIGKLFKRKKTSPEDCEEIALGFAQYQINEFKKSVPRNALIFTLQVHLRSAQSEQEQIFADQIESWLKELELW